MCVSDIPCYLAELPSVQKDQDAGIKPKAKPQPKSSILSPKNEHVKRNHGDAQDKLSSFAGR